MAGMNDVRVLRNILGDGPKEGDDVEVPHYVEKQLNRMMKPERDVHSRNGFWSAVKGAFKKKDPMDEGRQKAQEYFDASASASQERTAEIFGETTPGEAPEKKEFSKPAQNVNAAGLTYNYGAQNREKAEQIFQDDDRNKLVDLYLGKGPTPAKAGANVGTALASAWNKQSAPERFARGAFEGFREGRAKAGQSRYEERYEKGLKMADKSIGVTNLEAKQDVDRRADQQGYMMTKSLYERQMKENPKLESELKKKLRALEVKQLDREIERKGELDAERSKIARFEARAPTVTQAAGRALGSFVGIKTTGAAARELQKLDFQKSIGNITEQEYKERMKDIGTSGATQLLQSFGKTTRGAATQLGSGMGSSLVGSFQDAGATQRLRTVGLERQAYLDFLRTKYKSPNASEEQLYAMASPTQKKRLEDIRRRTGIAQSYAAGTGFLGSGAGQAAIARSRPAQNLGRFTQIGARPSNLGSFGPEAFGRLGVSQSVGAITPANKWDALLGRKPGEEKLALMLGKPAQPTPPLQTRTSAMSEFKFGADKMSALLGRSSVSNEMTEDPREKLRRFL